MKSSIVLITMLFCLISFGQSLDVHLNQAVPHGGYRIGVGSKVQLNLHGDSQLHSGLFLGRLINPNRQHDAFMFFDETGNRLLYASKDIVDFKLPGQENVLKSYPQVGGTCTGYAINNFMTQMNLLGFVGNGSLQKVLTSEEGRSQLLVDAINQYYLVLQHRFSVLGILNQYGRQFGFTCQKKIATTTLDAKAYFIENLSRGQPIMMSFNIGHDMATPNFSLVDVSNPRNKIDPRLWVPRQIGDRNNGGHTIVAEGMFVARNRLQLLVIDSDWDAPRVWDFEQFLGARTAFSEVEFYTCK